VEGLGICADGAVESVLLQCKCPVDQIRTVNLDPASRTSNLLAELLLKKHFHVRREIYFCDGISGADASVVIGDRALQSGSNEISYDLAAEWKNMTDLPFVFAVWVHQNDHPENQKFIRILHAAKDAGLGSIPELSRLYSKRLGLAESRCNQYLTSCIKYDLGQAEKQGMQLFWELCRSLPKIRRRTIKEEALKTRRIEGDEHKNRAIEPTFARIR
jgi:chorismate dehydratase